MDRPPRPFRPYAFLMVTWAVTVCANAFYIAPAPVFPEMIADLGLSKAQAGALISVYLLAILLFQVPAGYVLDRRDPRPTIVAATAVVLALSVLMYKVPRYDALLILRFLAGIPVAFLFVPSAHLVSRAFAKRPGRALGIFLSGPPAGVALGNLFGPPAAEAFGWPAVFVAFTLPWVALLPLFLWLGRPLPPRDHVPFALPDYLAAFQDFELWKVGAVFACSYAAYIFYASWSPTYLQGVGVGSAALLGLLSAAIPAAGIFARPLGGYLAEGRFNGDKRRVPILGFSLLGVTSILSPFLGAWAVPGLILAGFLAQLPFSVYYLLSAQIMPDRFAGSAYALMNTISLIGGTIAPGLAGLLVDVSGSFTAAFGMMAAWALLGLLLVLWVRER